MSHHAMSLAINLASKRSLVECPQISIVTRYKAACDERQDWALTVGVRGVTSLTSPQGARKILEKPWNVHSWNTHRRNVQHAQGCWIKVVLITHSVGAPVGRLFSGFSGISILMRWV